MDTADFLTNLDEMLGAFQMSTLALSREKLRVIMLTRQRQLADELEVSKGEVDLKLEEMGSLMNEVRCFIMSNLIKAEHKSLKKLTPYFNEIAMQLKRVSAEPEVLLTESTDGSILSFEEVRDLFTILIESTGTPRTLRAQARSLKDELEDSWHKLRKSKSHYKHTLTDVNEWKEFFEENSNVITEILDKREWWPES